MLPAGGGVVVAGAAGVPEGGVVAVQQVREAGCLLWAHLLL